MEKLDFLQHHLEHELAAVEDHNKVTIAKLQQAEAVSEGRLDVIEDRIRDSVVAHVEGSIGQKSQVVLTPPAPPASRPFQEGCRALPRSNRCRGETARPPPRV